MSYFDLQEAGPQLVRGVSEGTPLKLAQAVFVAAVAASFAAHGEGLDWLEYVAKPVPVLALAFMAHAWGPKDRYARLMTAGLLFSALGDELLVLPEDWDLFYGGMGAFAVTHLCYAAAFSMDASPNWGRLPPVAWLVGSLVAALWAELGDDRVPVLVYVALEGVMLWRALAQVGDAHECNAHCSWFAVVGAGLFVASDSLLAINKYSATIPRVEYPLLTTYWMGQLFLALSVKRHA